MLIFRGTVQKDYNFVASKPWMRNVKIRIPMSFPDASKTSSFSEELSEACPVKRQGGIGWVKIVCVCRTQKMCRLLMGFLGRHSKNHIIAANKLQTWKLLEQKIASENGWLLGKT